MSLPFGSFDYPPGTFGPSDYPPKRVTEALDYADVVPEDTFPQPEDYEWDEDGAP